MNSLPKSNAVGFVPFDAAAVGGEAAGSMPPHEPAATAVDAMSMNTNTGDAYAAVKAARGSELNRRIVTHEIGHCYAAKALGSFVELVTAVPNGEFAGRCVRRGAATSSSLNLVDDRKPPATAPTTEQMVTICATIGAPGIGTPRVEWAEETQRAMINIVELVAARVCERIFYPEHEPLPADHDLAEARALASVIASPQAVPALLAYAEAEAEALIRAHLGVVSALIDALVEHEHGTLTGDEVDLVIARAVVARGLAEEHERRRAWQAVITSASCFRAE
jgi:hypothetical protein